MMSRPLNDSPYLYGLHDPGGERLMAERQIPGWVLFTEAIGSDPIEQRGVDYTPWANQGFGVIVRLNNGYEPAGTIPHSARYGDFARRCGNFVRNSRGSHIWIIGNETNLAVERPGDEVILPAMYANCYRQCRSQIKAQAGHGQDQVIVAAPAPWNVQTTYPTNPSGDWIKYFADILAALGRTNCDGMAIHAYTHGWDPQKIYLDSQMAPPFQNRQFNFRVYRDFLKAVPAAMRDLPVYLTETNQDDPWRNANTGWVQRVYGEIDAWNRTPGAQAIRAVILYRWPNLDRWGIEGKAGVVEDFKTAMNHKYSWERALAERPATPDQSTKTDPEAETVQLRNRIAQLTQDATLLQVEIARLRAAVPSPARPSITDIVADLPRTAEQFIKRPRTEIKHLMIGHTGVAGSIGPQQMAEAQRSKWPGIISQYFVTAEGKILQTEPVDEVVAKDQDWIYHGIIIYMAGNFDRTSPPTVQLGALAALLAWLLTEHRLSETAIKGVSEFIQTKSPGAQWLTGQKWKETLLNRVRAVPFGSAGAEVGQLKAEVLSLGAQVAELEERLRASEAARAALQARLDALIADQQTVGLARPPITDISSRLPQDVGALKPRPLAQIEHVVVNHTSVAATVAAETIAIAHQKRWGAIAYHYFVTREGAILQTNALDEVIDLTKPMTAHGVNVALAGNFTNSAPPEAQLKAAAALIAWLLAEFHLPLASVKGAREWGGTASPGNQWTEGRAWKRALLTAIKAAGAATRSSDANGMLLPLTRTDGAAEGSAEQLEARVEQLLAALETSAAQIARLRQEQQLLRKSLDSATAEKQSLLVKLKALEAKIAQLEAKPAPTTPPASASNKPPVAPAPKRVAAPVIQNVIDQMPQHATLRYNTRPLKNITHLAIHHSAGPGTIPPYNIAAYHVRRDWPGIGYHFYVGPDGVIWQTNRLETISYNVYNANHYIAGICLAGRFMDGELPPAPQLQAVARLCAWLMQELKIPLANVRGHKEMPQSETACPGDQWLQGQRWKDSLVAAVKAVLADAQG